MSRGYDDSCPLHIPPTQPSPKPENTSSHPPPRKSSNLPSANPPTSLCANHVALHSSQMTHITHRLPHAHILNKFQPSDTTSPYPSRPDAVQARERDGPQMTSFQAGGSEGYTACACFESHCRVGGDVVQRWVDGVKRLLAGFK